MVRLLIEKIGTRYLSLVLVFILIMTGCNNSKSDYEKYEALKNGVKYKSYVKLSRDVAALPVNTYNKTLSDKTNKEIKEKDFRLLLCFAWILSGKQDFAIAESNIVINSDYSDEDKALAYDLLSMSMYEKGWNTLAVEMGKEGTSSKTLDKDAKNKSLAAWMIIGCYGVYSDDFDLAKAAFAKFGADTGVNWPYALTDAIADIKSLRIQSGLKKMKALSEDTSVPVEIRDEVKKTIKTVEEKTGDVDSAAFWPRLIATSIYSESKKVGDAGYKKIVGFLDEVQDKFNQIPELVK